MRLFIIFLLFVSAALAQRPVGPIRLADPNADRVMWWDDSEDRVDWMLPAEGRAWLDLEIGTDVQAYNAHLVDLADGLLPASKISIVDSGGYFDATTVEAALAEIILDGGAGGDSVSIDGVGVVDPNFQSTRDIAFFDDGGGDWSLYIRPNVIAYADFSVALQGTLTSDTEWDTAAEINAATTDADFLLDTAFIDDDTFATATASNIPSAESVKAYVDTEVAGASGTGDSVLVDGVNTVDPDFVSTGDVDFINNANTVTAEIKAGVIDLANLDAAIQASLALADTSLQPGDIGVTVQGYDADLADLADGTLSEGAIDAAITRDAEWATPALVNAAMTGAFLVDDADTVGDDNIDWATVTLADLTGAQIAPAISFNFGSAASFTLPAATLDGDLDAAGNNFTSVGDVTFQTGAAGGTLRTGTSNADKFTLQAYDVDGGAYVTLIEADAGNDVRLQIPVDSLDLEDSADITKIAHFDASGITTGTTRTFSFPDASGTLTLSETLGTASTAALIDDDTFATATAANIPSAESVKAYVDANAGGDLSTTDIDTFAELDAIVADKSLVNTTDTFDITVNNLDLAGSTAPVDTTEGRVQWDTDDDLLVVGTGAGTVTFTPGAGSGDSVSIDGAAVVDPDFVSTGDIDFVNDTNTITADINIDSIVPAMFADQAAGSLGYWNSSGVFSLLAPGTDNQVLTMDGVDSVAWSTLDSPTPFIIAMSDMETSITADASTVVADFYAPFDMTLVYIAASAHVAPTGGDIIIDVHLGAGGAAGTSVMLTDKVEIEAGEYRTEDALPQPTLTTTAVTDGQQLTARFDAVGATEGGKGIKLYIYYSR